MAAERRLLEKTRAKLVVLDDVDVLLLQRSLSTALLQTEYCIQIARSGTVL